MKLSHKIALSVVAGACVLTASAAELLKIEKATDFMGKQSCALEGGNMTFYDVDRAFQSAKSFEIDPNKTYRVSASFRKRSGDAVLTCYVGFVCFDKDGKRITIDSVRLYPSPDTLTELAAPVKKGDTVIKVKDASKWKADTTYCCVAFNAKGDFSDLPNYDVLYFKKNGIAKVGDVWEIQLTKPAGKDYAAGTAVREQSAGSTYLYAKYAAVAGSWVKLEGTVTGVSKYGDTRSSFWAGTKTVRILVMTQGMKKGSSFYLKNVTLEEVE